MGLFSQIENDSINIRNTGDRTYCCRGGTDYKTADSVKTEQKYEQCINTIFSGKEVRYVRKSRASNGYRGFWPDSERP